MSLGANAGGISGKIRMIACTYGVCSSGSRGGGGGRGSGSGSSNE